MIMVKNKKYKGSLIKMNMKKGFFFSMDAFFSILLFTIVIALIYLFFISFTSLQQQYIFADDLLTLLNRIKINELDLSKYPGISSLSIGNKNVTIVEQVVIFQDQSNQNAIDIIIDDLTSGLKGNYKFSLDIGNSIAYGTSSSNITNLVARSRITVAKKQS